MLACLIASLSLPLQIQQQRIAVSALGARKGIEQIGTNGANNSDNNRHLDGDISLEKNLFFYRLSQCRPIRLAQ